MIVSLMQRVDLTNVKIELSILGKVHIVLTVLLIGLGFLFGSFGLLCFCSGFSLVYSPLLGLDHFCHIQVS